MSALRDNIDTKGSNSYYFAHANTPTGPVWDGNETPKLLSKQPSIDGASNAVKSLTEYSWGDGKKVTVYIDWETMDSVDEASAVAGVVDGTLSFSFDAEGTTHKLVVGPLANEVEDEVTVTLKKDMFKLSLTKVDKEKVWTTLKKGT